MLRAPYLWKLRPYFRQVAGQLFIGSVAGLITNTAVVLPAILLGKAIDAALSFGQGEATASAVIRAALWYVGGTLLAEVPRVFKQWFLVGAGRGRMIANIRADALRGVLAWPMERLQGTSVGEVMAKINGDVDVLGQGIQQITEETWDYLLMEISVVVAMVVISPEITFWALLPVPVGMAVAKASGRWIDRRTTKTRESNSRLTSSIQEYIVGVRVLRVFGATGRALDRLAHLSNDQAETNQSLSRLKSVLLPVYGILMTSGVVFVVWLGAERVLAGALTVGGLVAFVQLYLKFIQRAPSIPQMLNMLQGGAAAYRRLEPVLGTPTTVKDPQRWASFRWGRLNGANAVASTAVASKSGPLAVKMEGVTFRYPGSARPTLKNISVNAKPGSLVAITGPVGSGKSALAKILVGLHPIQEGRFLLDGRPADSMPAEERHKRVTYVPQDPRLFSGTIRENLLLEFGSLQISSDVNAFLEEATRISALAQDLAGFPRGLDTPVGEMGVRVSGGQRQRIALARAIAAAMPATPGLLVLDDPFSAIDAETEAAVISGLRKAFGPAAPMEQRATLFLFSHRLGVFPEADFVVVLDQGEIVQEGTHKELMAQHGLYRTIYEAQRRISEAGEPAGQNRLPAGEQGPRLEAVP